MTKLDRMELVKIGAHLIITLAMLAIYALFAYLGKPITQIENMLFVIVGYWFGAMGITNIGGKKETEKKEDEVQ